MEQKNKTQRENEILSAVKGIIERNINPQKIILFGSRGKGNYYNNSDFDFAIDNLENIDLRKQREIREEIENIAGLYSIDIVYLKNIDETFKNLILRTGKVIYERRT